MPIDRSLVEFVIEKFNGFLNGGELEIIKNNPDKFVALVNASPWKGEDIVLKIEDFCYWLQDVAIPSIIPNGTITEVVINTLI